MDINDQNSLGYTLLMYNVNNAYNVLALLELGAITDLKNIYGSTALIEASNNNYLESVRLLLEHNADPNIHTLFGFTALMFASLGGFRECVRELLKAGASASIKNKYNQTAIDMSIERKHKSITKILYKTNITSLFKKDFLNNDLIRHIHTFL